MAMATKLPAMPSSLGVLANAPREQLASMSAAERKQREAQIVSAFQAALDSVMDNADDYAQRLSDIHACESLKGMANALKVSEESARFIAESTVRLYRAFGVVLHEIWPDLRTANRANNAELEFRTGITAVKCRAASTIAKYSKKDLDKALAAFREAGVLPGDLRKVVRELEDPGYIEEGVSFRRECSDEDTERRQLERARRLKDPNYEEITAIMEEFGNLFDACREIFRLRRKLSKKSS